MTKWINSSRRGQIYYSTYEIEGDRRSIRVEGSKVIAERHGTVLFISSDELHDRYPYIHVDKRRYRSGGNMVDSHTCYVMSKYIRETMYVVIDSGYEIKRHQSIYVDLIKKAVLFIVLGILAILLFS